MSAADGWWVARAAIAVAIAAAVAAASDPPEAPPWHIAGRVTNDAIREASGLAPSRRCSDLLWVVNDSGNAPRLWAIAPDGRDLGAADVEGVDNEDWEDLASAMINGRPVLAIADCGDNLGRRSEILIHIVDEPPADRTPRTVRPLATLRCRYSDGARDCESLAIVPDGSAFWLLSKREFPPALYEVVAPPVSAWTGGVHAAVVRRLGALAGWPPPHGGLRRGVLSQIGTQPTAMDLDPSGRRLLILTYEDAWLVPRAPDEPWTTALLRPPVRIALPDPADGVLRRREALCWDGAATAFFVTGEGRGQPLLRVTLPLPDAPCPAMP